MAVVIPEIKSARFGRGDRNAHRAWHQARVRMGRSSE
jgi:hypothetical protein